MSGRPSKRPKTVFGERLTVARQQVGLTQEQLAERLNTNQRVITYWERKPVALRSDQLTALADILGVSADFLLGRDSNRKARSGGPTGKVRQVFEKVSRLPRHQQSKVVEFVEAFVEKKAIV